MIPKALISLAEEQMEKTLGRMKGDMGSLRTGRASTTILENIRVDYYGAVTPLNQIGRDGGAGASNLGNPAMGQRRAWQEVEKAILKSDLGLTPSNDGALIRLQIPKLTEERRKDLIKIVRKMSEEYRVSLRNERRDAVERLKKAEKAKEITEDDRSSGEQEIQKLTDLVHQARR